MVVLRNTHKEEDESDQQVWTSTVKNEPINRTTTVKNGPADRTATVKNGPAERTIITLDSLRLWRPIRTFWKAYQAYFPMQ